MATVPQYFRDLYPTSCENAPAPHTIKNKLKHIDKDSYENPVQHLWDHLAQEFIGSLEPLEPFSEHTRKGGDFSAYQNFPLDRIRFEGPQGTTCSYSESSFCEAYTRWRSEYRIDDSQEHNRPDLVFAASRAHEPSTKRDKKRRKTNEPKTFPSQSDQSTHSKTSKFYRDFKLQSNEYLDLILSLVFEVKGRDKLPSEPFLQEAVYLISSYDACGCYLGGFAVGKEFACMMVINKETILFEVPEDTPLTTLGIDDMMDFLADEFTFPHEFSNDTEALDFIWRYFNIAWDAIKDLPLGRRLQRVRQPPWVSREGVRERLTPPLVELGGIHQGLAAFLEHAHGLKPKTATHPEEVTTPSSNVSSGNLDSDPTASRTRSQSPPRKYGSHSGAPSSLTPISDFEHEEEMSNVDDEDGADEEHDDEEHGADQRGVARVGGNGLGLASEMGPQRLLTGKTSEEILKTPIVGNHYSTRDVYDWLSCIPTFTPHDLLSSENYNTLTDKPPSFSKTKGSNNTSEDKSLGVGEVEERPAVMAGGVGFKRKGQSATAGIGEGADFGMMKDEGRAQEEREDRSETVERSESPCRSEDEGGSDILAFHDILLKRNIKFVLTEKSLFRAIVDNVKATPRV
ncbi:hypothetical protein L198_05845 [Cryptococcus wingfieldii CBS 7118]|uniref:Uncharacterized protein n=1 Tax=Cryptococcus wingfieldii CBS 7118 TaxID=1295528 RepID=A0A1E3IRU3_9TREE|nr:hypothetical protein L198_05845 [Cryptococcus wingfieldii CBS 7118]ODN91334.1 hypothetical protein L198_05845 [Cryptococcus wingfieldii CBS 7118]